jgi:hypothetical protein
MRWKFDGLRWRVFWKSQSWYPVLAPGPFPPGWFCEDLDQGWRQVRPPHSSIWHLVPPHLTSMPPPFLHPMGEVHTESRFWPAPASFRCRWRGLLD